MSTEVTYAPHMLTCAGTYEFPLSRPHDIRSGQSLTRIQNLPIGLQEPCLNWVPGAPLMNALKLTYMLYAALGFLQRVSSGHVVRWRTYTLGRLGFKALSRILPLTP